MRGEGGVVAVEAVVVASGAVSDLFAVAGGNSGVDKVSQEVEVQVAVAVVVEEGRLGGVARVSNAVVGSGLDEGRHVVFTKPLVDVEQILAAQRIFAERRRDVNIQPTILINIHQGHARAPLVLARYLRLRGDVLKLHIALIKVQRVVHHVAGEVQIRQAVVVKITHSHSPAVVDVFFFQNVERVVFDNAVGKGDMGLFGGNETEESVWSTLTAYYAKQRSHKVNSVR